MEKEEFNYKKEIEEILKTSKEAIKKDVEQKIKEKIVNNLSWSLDDEIKEILGEVVKTELKEEIKNAVIESKQAILEGIKPAFANIGAEIAKGLEEKAIETLKNSWKSEEIFKKLFD